MCLTCCLSNAFRDSTHLWHAMERRVLTGLNQYKKRVANLVRLPVFH